MKRSFGELETSILSLFKSEEKKTVKEVLIQLGNSDKYNTIMTVMNRLVEKKVLGRERKGLQCIYWVAGARKIPLMGLKPINLVNHLIDSDITDSELDEISKLIEAAKKKRGINE